MYYSIIFYYKFHLVDLITSQYHHSLTSGSTLLIAFHEIGHNFQDSWGNFNVNGRWNPDRTIEVTNLIFGKMINTKVIYSIAFS